MSKNLKIAIVLILVGCGGANSVDVISLSNTLIYNLQTYTNSVVAAVSMLTFVAY